MVSQENSRPLGVLGDVAIPETTEATHIYLASCDFVIVGEAPETADVKLHR